MKPETQVGANGSIAGEPARLRGDLLPIGLVKKSLHVVSTRVSRILRACWQEKRHTLYWLVHALLLSSLTSASGVYAADISIDVPASYIEQETTRVLTERIPTHFGMSLDWTCHTEKKSTRTLWILAKATTIFSGVKVTLFKVRFALHFSCGDPNPAVTSYACDPGASVMIDVRDLEVSPSPPPPYTAEAERQIQQQVDSVAREVTCLLEEIVGGYGKEHVCPHFTIVDEQALRLRLSIDFLHGCIDGLEYTDSCKRPAIGGGTHYQCRNGAWVAVSEDCSIPREPGPDRPGGVTRLPR